MNEVQTDWFLVVCLASVIWWLGYRDQQKPVASRPAIAVPLWVARCFGSPRENRISLHGAATQLLGVGMVLLMLIFVAVLTVLLKTHRL